MGEWAEGLRRLVVVARAAGDVQVEFHVPGRRGSPFEALFVIPDDYDAAVDEIFDFVRGLLDERTVLVMDGRWFRGGVRWVRPAELDALRHVSFAASWLGSFDTE